jgi:hypothetical protein
MRRADNLTTFTCRLSGNLGASTFWNPQDISRPVMGLFYLLYCNCGCRSILVLATLKMATWMAETCRWLPFNETYIHALQHILYGLCNKFRLIKLGERSSQQVLLKFCIFWTLRLSVVPKVKMSVAINLALIYPFTGWTYLRSVFYTCVHSFTLCRWTLGRILR